MEQTKALNALAPFLVLARSQAALSSPRQAADIIAQATSAPNTFVFAELLQLPAIQALRDDAQYAGHLRLLEIFTWGTLRDHEIDAAALPPLAPAQAHKLALLSLLSLCTTTAPTYAALTAALGLAGATGLEDLVAAAIYADLVAATLDPAGGAVHVRGVAALRDLRPGEVGEIVGDLEAWEGRCDVALGEIEGWVGDVKAEARRRGVGEREREAQRGRAEKGVDRRRDEDAMDVDGRGKGSVRRK